MSKYVIVTFPDEAKILEGASAIRDLHAKGRIYASVIVSRDLDGKLSVREITGEGHAGTAAGALIGGLAGLPAGPLAVTIGAAGGALIGVTADLIGQQAETAFVEKISRELAPGRTAIVVELAEDEAMPFRTMMEAIGGSASDSG